MDISPSFLGPILDRILTLCPERGSLDAAIQARINNSAVLFEFLILDEKDKSCRSFAGSTRDVVAQRVHAYTGWLRATSGGGGAVQQRKNVTTSPINKHEPHTLCMSWSCTLNPRKKYQLDMKS